jgi:pSer/pThr/pTyr-binding forkhead associated (FHA) protein
MPFSFPRWLKNLKSNFIGARRNQPGLSLRRRNAMKRTRIELRVTQGSLKGREFVFEGPARILVGRGEDCSLRLPADRAHAGVSRHHCLLELTPSGLRVRDLDSLNGTYVNGNRIGKQTVSHPSPAIASPCWSVVLRDGDEVRVGSTILRVTVRGLSEETEVALLAQGKES